MQERLEQAESLCAGQLGSAALGGASGPISCAIGASLVMMVRVLCYATKPANVDRTVSIDYVKTTDQLRIEQRRMNKRRQPSASGSPVMGDSEVYWVLL